MHHNISLKSFKMKSSYNKTYINMYIVFGCGWEKNGYLVPTKTRIKIGLPQGSVIGPITILFLIIHTFILKQTFRFGWFVSVYI